LSRCERGDRIAQFLNGPLKDEKRKVHIIAHSAGGVTAAGTPHDGTPIAASFTSRWRVRIMPSWSAGTCRPNSFGVNLPLLPEYDHLDLYRRIADEIAPLGE